MAALPALLLLLALAGAWSAEAGRAGHRLLLQETAAQNSTSGPLTELGLSFDSFDGGRSIRIVNKCSHTVWPGVLPNPESAMIGGGGWEMPSRTAVTATVPPQWQGRIWGRTGCKFERGRGSCETGGCGDRLQCAGIGGEKPATLAEILLSGWNNQDFYDISLVDGYNIQMTFKPIGDLPGNAYGSDGYWCGAAVCTTDLNQICPSELQIKDQAGAIIGCTSACEKFLTPEYCCTGSYNAPHACSPSSYSQVFKSACPTAYSYAYDDASSTFACRGTSYEVVFCP